MLLHRRRTELLHEEFNIAGDDGGLDAKKREVLLLAPETEAMHRPQVRLTGIGVPNVGGEELDKSTFRVLASILDDRRDEGSRRDRRSLTVAGKDGEVVQWWEVGNDTSECTP